VIHFAASHWIDSAGYLKMEKPNPCCQSMSSHRTSLLPCKPSQVDALANNASKMRSLEGENGIG
jgi:hypothetical protein